MCCFTYFSLLFDLCEIYGIVDSWVCFAFHKGVIVQCVLCFHFLLNLSMCIYTSSRRENLRHAFFWNVQNILYAKYSLGGFTYANLMCDLSCGIFLIAAFLIHWRVLKENLHILPKLRNIMNLLDTLCNVICLANL